MKYAEVVPFDVCNGKGCGASIFVQGCSLHCVGCFNQEAWDFNGGKEWNDKVKSKFLDIVSKHYIKRVSILGGEPLESANIDDVYDLIVEIKEKFPEKNVWLYTGKRIECLTEKEFNVISKCDVVVDGAYIDALKDLTLPFRGSSNQRLIDVQKSLEQNEIVLYNK
jgi:anaerobic ribonucleoside-triphosphate reductase activating protein